MTSGSDSSLKAAVNSGVYSSKSDIMQVFFFFFKDPSQGGGNQRIYSFLCYFASMQEDGITEV